MLQAYTEKKNMVRTGHDESCKILNTWAILRWDDKDLEVSKKKKFKWATSKFISTHNISYGRRSTCFLRFEFAKIQCPPFFGVPSEDAPA